MWVIKHNVVNSDDSDILLVPYVTGWHDFYRATALLSVMIVVVMTVRLSICLEWKADGVIDGENQLWNELPSSFRQPHSVHCPPGLSHPAHDLITVTTFALIIYHSLGLSLQTKNSSFSQILFYIVTLIPSGLPLRILNLHWTKWARALFVLVSFSVYVC